MTIQAQKQIILTNIKMKRLLDMNAPQVGMMMTTAPSMIDTVEIANIFLLS